MTEEPEGSQKPQSMDNAESQSAEPIDRQKLVWDALRMCYDPEIPVNIVDLGLIYKVTIEEELPEEANVFITMTLTAPGCALAPMIASDVRRKVQAVRGVRNVKVDIVFEPSWNPGMMSEAARLVLNM